MYRPTKKSLALLATVGSLTGAAVALAEPTSVKLVNNQVYVPCGIDIPTQANPAGSSNVYYTIGNCHAYSVVRYPRYSDGSNGSCHNIPAERGIEIRVSGKRPTSLGVC